MQRRKGDWGGPRRNSAAAGKMRSYRKREGGGRWETDDRRIFISIDWNLATNEAKERGLGCAFSVLYCSFLPCWLTRWIIYIFLSCNSVRAKRLFTLLRVEIFQTISPHFIVNWVICLLHCLVVIFKWFKVHEIITSGSCVYIVLRLSSPICRVCPLGRGRLLMIIRASIDDGECRVVRRSMLTNKPAMMTSEWKWESL